MATGTLAVHESRLDALEARLAHIGNVVVADAKAIFTDPIFKPLLIGIEQIIEGKLASFGPIVQGIVAAEIAKINAGLVKPPAAAPAPAVAAQVVAPAEPAPAAVEPVAVA